MCLFVCLFVSVCFYSLTAEAFVTITEHTLITLCLCALQSSLKL